ncbi:3-oxoacyl-[acyl-carrier-protein] reductase [bacterium]|nr:3-oxoacyl-[acyl-carrier-protein] reductase [bacterium]
MRLKGKVTLVTGGGRGIGRAISLALGKEGARVCINYLHSKDAAEEVVKRIKENKGEAIGYKADVSKLEEVNRMVEEVNKKFGRIDILINNAGLNIDKYLMIMNEEEWDKVIDVNLKGTFNCSKAVSRVMIGQKSGNIVNISSVSAIAGTAGQTNYSAAKGGMISFTKSLARELAPFGIRVNALAPGLIDTEMVKKMPEEMLDRILKITPLKRVGTPEEVAKVVIFLVSEEADYITGQVIRVDGGLSM